VTQRRILPWPMATGPAVLDIQAALARALTGVGPALAPHAAGSPAPPLPHVPAELPAALAVVVGTSGSTGSPKLTMLTATNLRASADATHERLGGPGRWTLALPAQHVAGLQVLVRSLRVGLEPAVVDLTEGFDVAAFARVAGTLGPGRQFTSLVPTQLVRLLADVVGAQALRRYDAVLVGGAASPADLLAQARDEGVAVVTTYGMSETAGGCVYDGLPLNGVQVRLADDGRISLGGPTVAAGYLSDSGGSTNAAFSQEDGVAWFRTDDAGHLHDGRLVADGRLDDMIVTGGFKVAPSVVEAALVAHVEGVLEAVVVGVPDPEWGQIVAAAVVLRRSSSQTPDEPGVDDVRAALRGRLPDRALPRAVVSLPGIPMRGPGKPDRRAVRAAIDIIIGDRPTYDR